MSLLKFLGLEKKEDANLEAPAETTTLQKITLVLDAMEPDRARYIAAFSYILGRVAHADLEISEKETCEIEKIVMRWGKLPEEQAAIVVQIAKTQNILFGHTESYLVTREFSKVASREQKLDLLHCLFAVSSSDENVSAQEVREIRQITSELKLDHRDFISVRSSYREHLSLFKKS